MLRTFATATLSALLLSSCMTPVETGAPESAAPPQAAQPTPVAQASGPHPGEAVYKTRCAACHDNSEATKAPSPETMARLTPGHITNALMTGIMIPQAVGLSSKEVSDVSNYLAKGGGQDDSWTTAMRCPASRATPKLDAAPTVATFGFDTNNTRRLDPTKVGPERKRRHLAGTGVDHRLPERDHHAQPGGCRRLVNVRAGGREQQPAVRVRHL
jgi:mono/diheme cytochrome c family protein